MRATDAQDATDVTAVRPNLGRLAATVAIGVALGLIAAAILTRLVPAADSASHVADKARGAAIAAVEGETTALGAPDDGALRSMFTGTALASEEALRAHVRDLISNGTDYPGDQTLSNIEVIGVSGDYSTTMTVEFSAHVKLANMRHGAVRNYSESDIIHHVVMAREDGVWKVAEISWRFAPGGGP